MSPAERAAIKMDLEAELDNPGYLREVDHMPRLHRLGSFDNAEQILEELSLWTCHIRQGQWESGCRGLEDWARWVGIQVPLRCREEGGR